MKKLLLDENLPIDLRLSFSDEFDVYTVKYLGWDSLQNGKLLTKLQEQGFYALITADKNIMYQQNLEKYQIKIITLNCKNTILNELKPFIPLVELELRKDHLPIATIINKEV